MPFRVIGFGVETYEMYDSRFLTWCLGGQRKMRPLFRHYYNAAEILFVVIDASDRERMDELREELQHAMRDDQLSAEVSIFFVLNKVDLPVDRRMSRDEVEERLELWDLTRSRRWLLLETSATKRTGLTELKDAFVNHRVACSNDCMQPAHSEMKPLLAEYFVSGIATMICQYTTSRARTREEREAEQTTATTS